MARPIAQPKGLIAAPPVDLWPTVTRRIPVPPDVETLLLAELEQQQLLR